MSDHPFDPCAIPLDTPRARSYDSTMPVWRCPHCSTPQAEAARCWVCHRSTTSCASCRHFRSGVASGLGMCGLDPRRVALTGREMRACWAPPDAVVEAVPGRSPATAADRAWDSVGRQPRTFVPVEDLVARPEPVAGPPPAPVVVADADTPAAGVWSLWGDVDVAPHGEAGHR